ncbi:MAG: metalloregulator ArsR/SmtB family transcription factor [Maricaulaceae bacterium]|jgi:ArsR family transcriptional regulator
MTQIDDIVAVLKAAGEPTRLRILALLARGELTVSELVQLLGQSQPRVSRHLKLLAEAGLIERLPEGAWVFYRLADGQGGVRRLADAAVHLAGRDDPAVARDLERLEAVKTARAEAARAYFKSVAKDWDRIRALHLSESAVEAAMREAAGPGPFDLMIDVGTGTARILKVFADRIERGVGVDLSHDMLTVARSNLERDGAPNCSVRHADIYALPFENGCADLVVIHQVLHYLVDPALAIFEAARTLKEGGRLLIVDFAPHTHEFLRDEHAHRRLGFSDEEVEEWTRAAGLELDHVSTLAPSEGTDEGLTVKIWRARQTASVALADAAAGAETARGAGGETEGDRP